MWVKICGTTIAGDAQDAVEAGADAVGFIFVPQSRRVTSPQAVRAMKLSDLPAERIGVFATPDADAVARAVDEAGLTGVQLHGGGAGLVELAGEVRERVPLAVSIMPVVHWEVGKPGAGEPAAEGLRQLRTAGFHRILLDAKVGAALGGTGVSLPWAEAAGAIATAREGLELVLAGGLRPETVGEAVRVLRPWGVDVVTGVEREPGRKSAARVRAFLAAARAGEESPRRQG